MQQQAHISPFKGPGRPRGHALSSSPRGRLPPARSVKQAMLADYGSRDIEFRAIVKEIRSQLLKLANCNDTYECVIMQGSGTFAIEAALGSLCPESGGKTLVVANGAYGDRAAQILDRIGRVNVKIDKGDQDRTHR